MMSGQARSSDVVIRDSKPHDHPLVVPVTALSPDTTHQPHKMPESASSRTQPLNDTALGSILQVEQVVVQFHRVGAES